MKKEYKMKFITPCFCAGCDQGQAEIRPTSIRGELRKWLRLVGATLEQECAIMGGINGEPSKSLVTIRVSEVSQSSEPLPRIKGIDPTSYTLFFASVSGDHKGQRIAEGAYIPANSTFKMTVITKATLTGPLFDLFEQAMQAMLLLGAIGLRASRTCGAWAEEDSSDLSYIDYLRKIQALNLPTVDMAVIEQDYKPAFTDAWKDAIYRCGLILQEGYRKGKPGGGRKTLSAGKSGNQPTPLGSSSPRQKSGLNLRPIKTAEGTVPFMYYTNEFLAPASKVVRFDFEDCFDPTNCQGLTVSKI